VEYEFSEVREESCKKYCIWGMRWFCFLAILSLERSHQEGEDMDQRKVVLYARSRSLNGWRAARLLRRIGCYFDVIDPRSSAPKVLAELSNTAKQKVSAPYVFVDHRPVGGMGTVRALVGSGSFDHLLRDDL
jgi:glutaredoxin